MDNSSLIAQVPLRLVEQLDLVDPARAPPGRSAGPWRPSARGSGGGERKTRSAGLLIVWLGG